MCATKDTNSIEIALPREKVAQLLADPAQIPKCLCGVVLHEPVSETHGQPGTESRVVMQSGKRKIERTETITRRNPADLHEIPTEVVVHFDREIAGAGRWSALRDRLTEADPETTLWESEYRFDSLPIRLMGQLMPRLPQAVAAHAGFKAFAEQGKNVREGRN
ncbi:hypothetical protein ATK36_0258 [Amycolatopsis sulphurea]|uniref:Polyketide cyclase/dehydrase/lipid transport protein n=1 Tax=Amycolatopsis sulphurea TaxID=76022 RepID=A0A2A9FZ41_9PSEU|nr:SRPBCC family protein [Amycolatopsis sulphurea]PFG56737.1 hypothetical protein ATK36_0258 [Amycolatopsis sulphurea]